ncbi:FAD-dependent oxidoreductase [Actinomyces bowdenii]|uniref:ferredoxin--NADP(+) reductase n=1 Tax=Actinomyces bowdenii TaxID=131109 RepID=A0A853EJ19_9ACTO|nr:FAD-dependent oxidoreductase [Actinomyces bowdenii]MBF0697184.1 FAD-dependent oxidoreductase [Actinomyces bowdenii]NYS69357.1 FAD-dependent oxidoreductase [Actinomyces bowdenii]
MNTRPLSVAVVGAGPAGIYAADILSKSGLDVSIDLFERLPAPYGLVRYGVAPDHPRIKQIIVALYKILQRGDIRLVGNVEVGRDITVAELQEHYDALVFSTGADTDAPLDIPGADAPECHGGADFVSWYDGHPDHPRTWDLSAKEVAVIGVGNVALDIARVLAKHSADLMTTEIPANVAQALAASPVTDVHVFGRRGPAQVKFTPLELRELGKQPDVDVIVYEEDFEYDEGSQAALAASNQQRQVVKALEGYAMQEPEELTASRRIHIHLFAAPAEVLTDEEGHVVGLRTERTRLTGDGSVTGTGQMRDWPAQAVYRAVGYAGSPIPGLPFDEAGHVLPNEGGRVLGEDGRPLTGIYATGWIRRGPIGLIGSTKSDAQETITNLVADAEAGLLRAGGEDSQVGHDAVMALLTERGVPFTTWQGWELLDAYERELGQGHGPVEVSSGEAKERERVKVVSREAMTAISRSTSVPEDLIGRPEADRVPERVAHRLQD